MLDFFKSNKSISNTQLVLSPTGEPLNTIYNGDYTENKKSPFSIYPGDSHKLILPPKRTSQAEVDYLLDIGFIGDIENAILTIANNLIYFTSHQVHQLLELADIRVDFKKIQYILKRLKDKSFLRQIEFFSENNSEKKSSFKAYTLGQHGAGIFFARGSKARLQGYIKEMPTANIKKALAANQLLIAVMQSTNASFESLLCVFDKNDSKDNIIRPQAILQSNNETYFIECTRRTDGWVEDFKERLVRYKKVMDHYDTLNVKLSKVPSMIFIAEDFKHMLEIQKLTAQYNDIIKLFTYDLAIYENVHTAFYKNS